MSEVVDQLAFDDPTNLNGWNQGFDITYKMEDFIEHPLQVFVVPHSHNDPGMNNNNYGVLRSVIYFGPKLWTISGFLFYFLVTERP